MQIFPAHSMMSPIAPLLEENNRRINAFRIQFAASPLSIYTAGIVVFLWHSSIRIRRISFYRIGVCCAELWMC